MARSVALLLGLTASATAITTPKAAPAMAGAAPKSKLRKLFSSPSDPVLVCPVDRSALTLERSVIGSTARQYRRSASGRSYPVRSGYTDLVATASGALSLDALRAEVADAWASRTQTQLFRSPLTSFLYERGWRQNFNNAGFPGIDKEYAEVEEFFIPNRDGVCVDMSCGSGLMSRRLAKGGNFARVIAMDYSETMLAEARRRAREAGVRIVGDGDNDVDKDKNPGSGTALELCRADVAQLPLATDSVACMHAGAALHSWPRLEKGLEEIGRVLRPGGRFFATTFIQGAYGVRFPGDGGGGGGSFRFFKSEDELSQLLVDAGFARESVSVRTVGRGCAIVRAVWAEEVEGEAKVAEASAKSEEVVAEELSGDVLAL